MPLLQPVDQRGEFPGARRKVLTDVVQHLSAVVGRRLGPATGGAGRFDRVPDILAVSDRGLSDQFALWVIDIFCISTIGPGLFPSDIQLRCAVHRLRLGAVPCEGGHRFQRVGILGRPGVGAQPLPAAFAAKAAFANSSEPGGGVEHVGPVDPDHARDQLWREVQRGVDVL